MPSFNTIRDTSDIQLNDKWVPATKFNSRDRIVEKGGRQFQIIRKYQRDYTTCEKVLALLAVICSFGLALLSKTIKELLTKRIKTVRYAVPAPASPPATLPAPAPKPPFTEAELEQARLELEQGIEISDAVIALIQEKFEDICNGNDSNELESNKHYINDRVFTLKIAPGLIFTMQRYQTHPSNANDMKNRHQNIVTAQTAINKNNLNLLEVPHAKLFTVEIEGVRYGIIAHEKVDFNTIESMQEQLYEEGGPNLDETVRQLATLICKTGLDTVAWRKIPLLQGGKAALVNIKTMNNKEDGLLGLVSCVNEEQGKMVEQIAKENGVNTARFGEAHEKRKAAIEENRKLKEFYARKNIVKGDEPVIIDETLLSFPEDEEKLKNLVKGLVGKINAKIKKNSPEESIKGRRTIFIDTCSHHRDYKTEHRDVVGGKDPESFTEEEFHNATFLGTAVTKLIELGAIHRLIYRGGRGYTLQA